MITIDIVGLPAKTGQEHQQWQAWLDDELLCTAREPLGAAARVLLKRGVAPDTRLAMRHKGAARISLTSTVATATALTVGDDPQGRPRFRTFQAYPDQPQE